MPFRRGPARRQTRQPKARHTQRRNSFAKSLFRRISCLAVDYFAARIHSTSVFRSESGASMFTSDTTATVISIDKSPSLVGRRSRGRPSGARNVTHPTNADARGLRRSCNALTRLHRRREMRFGGALAGANRDLKDGPSAISIAFPQPALVVGRSKACPAIGCNWHTEI